MLFGRILEESCHIQNWWWKENNNPGQALQYVIK